MTFLEEDVEGCVLVEVKGELRPRLRLGRIRQSSIEQKRRRRQDGHILRPRTNTRRRDQVIRSMSSRSPATSSTQIIGEGETVYKVWVGVCLGRTGSWHAEMDGRKVMECKQSIRKLPYIQRDGGQERRRELRATTNETDGRKDAR